MQHYIVPRSVVIWLYTGIVLIYCMVAIGGITRLTDSGLSMVNWSLVLNAFPPMSHEGWEAAFEAYKTSPQFKEINTHFTLDEFKGIYWWEYIHRALGRFIGMVFLIPFMFFLAKKMIPRKLIAPLMLVFVLGGFQAFLGWYMVESGLYKQPAVSHFRLAAHLCTAFLTISVLYMILLKLRKPDHTSSILPAHLRNWSKGFLALVVFQIVYGAFVAGLDAGLVHNTWPKMNGEWVHPAVFSMNSWVDSLLNTRSGVQFVHRYAAIALLIAGVYIAFKKWRNLVTIQRTWLLWLAIVVSLQFILGISALLLKVPIWLGVLHQIGALTLLLLTLRLAFSYKPFKLT